jgi:hypothetical protein
MNMANYAKGLLDELDGAIRTGATGLAADIRAELEKVAPAARRHIADLYGMVEEKVIKTADGQEVENKLVADLKAVGTRLDAALGAPADTTTPPAAK